MGSDCAPIDAQMHRVLALSFSGVLFGDSWIGEVHGHVVWEGLGVWGAPHAGVPEIVTPHTPHPSQTTAHELSDGGSIRIGTKFNTPFIK